MRAAWRAPLVVLASGVLLLLPVTSAAAAPVYPPASGFLVDQAGVIGAGSEQQIEASLADYTRRTRGEVAVAVVKNLDGTDIADYANELFDRWKVGDKQKDLGVLLVIAVAEKRNRIETGYGAEALVTDVQSKAILNSLQPALRAGNYAAAVDLGQRSIRRALGDDQADAAAPIRTQTRQRGRSSGGFPFFLVIPLIFLFMSIGRGRRRRGGIGGGGWGVPIILGSTLGSGGYGGGGFGGSSGGFGGGGGGGFGGFGGGDSGGGGASGDW